MVWVVEFDPDAVKDLKKLDKQVQIRILELLRKRLSTLINPRELGEALAGSKLGNYWKYRVGDWRIICDLQDDRIVVRVGDLQASELADSEAKKSSSKRVSSTMASKLKPKKPRSRDSSG